MVIKNKFKIVIFSLLVLMNTFSCGILINRPLNIYGFDFNSIAMITVPNKDRIDVMDMTINRVTQTLPTMKRPTGIAVNPEQDLIMVSNNNSGNISFYSRYTEGDGASVFKQVGVIGNGSKPDGVAFNPNKDIKEAYAIYQGDSKMLVLDTKDRNNLPKIISTFDLKGYSPKEIAVTKDGSKIYITDNLSGKLIILKRQNNSFSKTDIPLIENVEQIKNKDVLLLDGMFIDSVVTVKNSKNKEVKFGSDRVFIANPSQDNIIVIKDEKVEATITLKESIDKETNTKDRIGPKNMAIYRNVEKEEQKLYVTGNTASVVSVIDLKTLKLIKTITLTQNTNLKDGYNPVGISVGKYPSGEDLIYITNTSGMDISAIDAKKDTLKRINGTSSFYCCQDPLGELITLGVKTNY